MKLEKVRKLSLSELHKEVDRVRQKITEVRSEVLMHRVKNHRELRVLKQDLAKLLTVSNEKALLAEVTESENIHV